jgi:rubrerythrin
MRCGICGFIYEDHGDEVLSRCPNCDRLNERFNREAL